MDFNFFVQTGTGIAIGMLAYFMKQTMNDIREDIKANNCKVDAAEDRFDCEIGKIKHELSELKADLPIVFTLREDFIRSLNNVDSKLDKIMSIQLDHYKEERRNTHVG